MRLVGKDSTKTFDGPGPGSYLLPSEFGIYVSKTNNSMDENKNNISILNEKVWTD